MNQNSSTVGSWWCTHKGTALELFESKTPQSSVDHTTVNFKHVTFNDHLNFHCRLNAKLFSFLLNLEGLFSRWCPAAHCLCCSSWWFWKLILSEMPPHPTSLPICFSIPALWVLLLPCLHNKYKDGSGPGFLPDKQTSK